MDTTTVNLIEDCLDCVPFALQGDWGEFIVCGTTVIGAFFARFFEKRRMKRKARRDGRS